MREITLGVIKPEGLQRKLLSEIELRIATADLKIIERHAKILSEDEFELLHGQVVEPAWLHQARREYMTQNLSMILIVAGENAVKKLLKLRGCSNPANALPGTIRGDFAADQDYLKLREEKKIAMNIFHACDSEQDALKFIDALR